MEHPHNAILIVCSSHEKGCRSYICDTSYRHSNCLDRFKNLKEKNPNNTSSSPDLNPGSFPVSVDSFPVTVTFPVTVDTFPVSVDTFPVSVNTFPVSVDTFPVSVDTFPVSVSNFKCPLCRGTVSGLRVIEEARKYLNSKLRSCSRESCVFAGNYRELREHARRVHPTVRPADVDPSRERAWRRLEDQREYNDTVSAVPGSVVVGDYAIERSGNGATRGEFDSSFGDDFMTRILLYHMMHSMNNLEPVERYQRPRLRGYARSRPPVYVESVMDHDSGSGGRRRRYLWGENLLGLQNHEDDDDDNDDDVDLACSSEKLCNLEILVMHVASRENDFETFGSEEEGGPVERALEFDLLYGFLDSQVRELEIFLYTLQNEITSSHELITSFKQLGYVPKELEEKFQDCENSLKWSFEQVSDIKTQSANFQRILLASSGDENWRDNKELRGLGNTISSDLNAKIKMQTAEQQRDILRMLEKSLAREMDLEKKLSESKQNEEDLSFRLQQQVYIMEEEAEEMWERLLEAENSAEILLAISKELSGRLQTAQLNINGSTQKIQDLREQLKEKDCALQVSESSLREFETKAGEAEKRAEVVEAECKSLRESNVELNNDLNCLKGITADKTGTVEQMEKQLKESELKRMHAVATAEASQEKESMLDCTIKDMENLIKNLKSKVVKAGSQIESAEEKCIILSETNAELVEEINFLRRRTEQLETSLQRADEGKKETAKDIGVRTKLITDLVVQLALERERLRKQISALTKENKVAVKYLQRIKEPSVTVIGSHDSKANEVMFMDNDSKDGISRRESNEELMVSSVTSYEIGNEHRDSTTTEIKTPGADTTSELNTVRNIDARQLKFKSVLMVSLVLLIPAFAAFLFRQSVF